MNESLNSNEENADKSDGLLMSPEKKAELDKKAKELIVARDEQMVETTRGRVINADDRRRIRAKTLEEGVFSRNTEIDTYGKGVEDLEIESIGGGDKEDEGYNPYDNVPAHKGRQNENLRSEMEACDEMSKAT